ncbi:MAG: hypothetical protein CMJ24_08445 [Phycisphaerae bacterium]|nr:hypothetical protein [Phycisphaerae bacterium]|tara:strand:+ start:2389 stop:2928 length:540 start_codon:yes stop_codon:yes gene_type:complete
MSDPIPLEGLHLWQRAMDYAARRHEGQYRRNGVTPYASHPLRVAMVISAVFGIRDERILAAAAMHDLIEDTPVDYDEIAEHFGHEIAGWVAAMSKDMRLPEARREEEYDRALASAPWPARLIKLADVYDNLADCREPHHRKKAAEKAARAVDLAIDVPELKHAAGCVADFLHTIHAGDS